MIVQEKKIDSIKVKCRAGDKAQCSWTGTVREYKEHEKTCPFVITDTEHFNSASTGESASSITTEHAELLPTSPLSIFSDAAGTSAGTSKIQQLLEFVLLRIWQIAGVESNLLTQSVRFNRLSDGIGRVRRILNIVGVAISRTRRVLNAQNQDIVTTELSSNLIRRTGETEGKLSETLRLRHAARSTIETLSRGQESTQSSTGACEDRLASVENSVATIDGEVASRGERLDYLETVSYDGCLLWKIPQFSEKTSAAKRGGVSPSAFTYSPVFCTTRYGYRMRGKAYLNGDGAGAGTHLSIFVQLMRGEYDATLAWPFRQKVSITLLDQNSQRRHVSDWFLADQGSAAVARPSSAQNVAIGCPTFVKLSEFVDPKRGFLVDDCIFIKIQIDCVNQP